jgi:hypothetical protein
VKFIIMQFSPRSVFLSFRSEYPPQYCLFLTQKHILNFFLKLNILALPWYWGFNVSFFIL